ncbi:MAG: flagellar motor protein MotA, partial [Rhodospirillaceae bacterium]|nr:flagellar motor protein MotA [Rhodospirillaceae bacterium]
MSELRPFLIRMSAFLVIVVAICAGLFATLLEAFLANPALNGVILGVLVIGIVFIYRQVLRLAPEAAWLAAARTNVPGQSVQRAP